jgi:hypothetical protein
MTANATGTTANDTFTVSRPATMANQFRNAISTGYGVVFANSHGDDGVILVERHNALADCAAARRGYTATFNANSGADGVLRNGVAGARSNSLFTGADWDTYIGFTITDAQGYIPAGTTITGEDNNAHLVRLSAAAAGIPPPGHTANDTFTVSLTNAGGTYNRNWLTCGTANGSVAGSSTLSFTVEGARALFRDANSIVYLSACFSNTLYPGFNTARDFVGYTCKVGGNAALNNAELFFGRMVACNNLTFANLTPNPCTGGNRRWATIATGATLSGGAFRSQSPNAGFSGCGADAHCFRYTHRPNVSTPLKLDTDLSPAVKQVIPKADSVLTSPRAHSGAVLFDTKMDTTVDPTKVLSVQGCGASVVNPTWVATSTVNALDFSLQTATAGTLTLTVKAPFAKAMLPNGSQLDGNQTPATSNHVGPNQDDYVWKVTCRAVQVLVGYADGFHGNPQFPAPWAGSPGVTFEGCQPISSCTYDSGAVRIVNSNAVSVTINSVAVHVDTCTYTGWPSATLAPGAELIVTQLAKAGAANGCTGPRPHQMDTSDVGPGGIGYAGNCNPDGITPTVDVVVNGTMVTYSDTSKVLNTGGLDRGSCPIGTNESTQWTAL